LRTDSLGGTLTYVFDNARRLTSEQFSGTGPTGTVVRVDFGYNNRDDQTSITWYTDLAGTTVLATSAYSFDDAGRLTGITNKDSTSATLSYYNYSYDNADRVSNQTWWSKVGTVVYSGSTTYSYDATSQLTSDGASNYSYDANGNRTMAGYQTGTNNRMTNDGTYTYTYDAAGNMTQKSKGSGQETWYFGYDNRNDLTSIRETSDGTTNTLTVTYTYDALGERVKEQDWVTGGSTTETRFAFDGRNIWADLDSSNAVLVRRLFEDGVDQVLARTVGSGATAGVSLYLTDNQGSVRDLLNSSAQVQDHLDYTGFGVLTESNPSVGDGYACTGLKEQKGAGILLAWHRPELLAAGRWMAQDPILFQAGDPNLYRYVDNSATNGTDRSGLAAPPVPASSAPPQYQSGITLTAYVGEVFPPTVLNPGSVKPEIKPAFPPPNLLPDLPDVKPLSPQDDTGVILRPPRPIRPEVKPAQPGLLPDLPDATPLHPAPGVILRPPRPVRPILGPPRPVDDRGDPLQPNNTLDVAKPKLILPTQPPGGGQ
jgi:RHS repeat-associated protein